MILYVWDKFRTQSWEKYINHEDILQFFMLYDRVRKVWSWIEPLPSFDSTKLTGRGLFLSKFAESANILVLDLWTKNPSYKLSSTKHLPTSELFRTVSTSRIIPPLSFKTSNSFTSLLFVLIWSTYLSYG